MNREVVGAEQLELGEAKKQEEEVRRRKERKERDELKEMKKRKRLTLKELLKS